jgi:signal transduction histidine kinase
MSAERASGLQLPMALARRKELCMTEEIAASLRHRILGDLAGLGATLMTLRRRLNERYPAATGDLDIRALLDDLDGRVISAGDRIPHRGLPPPERERPGVPVSAAVLPLIDAAEACAGVRVQWDGGGRQARIDPEELQVAVACLLENAVDAVQAKGRGVVAVSSPDGGENQAILEIADDGEGLTPEAGAKLFEAFFSTRPGRLGLGLNVARRLARRWGGEVTVAPRPPHGTRVRLVLPYGS